MYLDVFFKERQVSKAPAKPKLKRQSQFDLECLLITMR